MDSKEFKLDVLKKLINESPLSKAKIAEIAGIKPNSLSRILAGSNQLNSVETLEGLAKALGVHPGLFFGKFDRSKLIQSDTVEVPLVIGFSNLKGGIDLKLLSQIPTPKSMLQEVSDVADALWVQAVGNSLAPRIRHNDQVLVVRIAPKNGDLVIVIDRRDHSIHLKRYMEYNDHVSFIPENPNDTNTFSIAISEIEKSLRIYKVIRIALIP